MAKPLPPWSPTVMTILDHNLESKLAINSGWHDFGRSLKKSTTMDQTSFSLLAGLLVGSHLGALGLRTITDWSLWVCYPIDGLVGLLALAAIVYAAISWLGNRSDRKN